MSQSLPHAPPPPDAIARAFSRPPFSAAREGGAPTVLIRGIPLRLAWANRAAAELFDASGYDMLQRRLAATGGSMSRRLSDVMATARIGALPRLERLRFASGSRVHNLTALCERGIDLDGEPTLILAFTGAEAEAIARRASWSEAVPGQPADEPAVPGLGTTGDVRPDVAAPVPDFGGGETSDHGLEEQRDVLRRALGGSDVRRFVWRTDAEGALVEVDEALMRQLGLPLVHDEQTPLAEQVAGFDPSGAYRLQEALAAGSTWSGIDILCPVLGSAGGLPVTLAASPCFDAARQFSGFRGFGRFDVAKLQPWRLDLPALPVEGVAPPPSWSPPVVPHHVHDHLSAGETFIGDGASIGLDEAAPGAPPRGPEPDVPADVSQTAHNRAANVVQLWPAHLAMSSGRAAFPSMKGLSKSVSAGTPEIVLDAKDGIDEQARSSVETDIEQKGALTSSEHLAFQEIGRALGAGARRMTSSAARESDAPLSSDFAELPPTSDNGLTRHAAAIVETMSAGLFVVLRKRVLFANEALREALRFESHAELLDALALHFARTPPPNEAQYPSTLSLPSAYGEEVTFSSSSRVIAWNGQSANLWTLSALDPPVIVQASHALVTGAPAPEGPRTAEADLISAMEVVGEAVAIIDATGRLLDLNRQAERWFGRERQHVAGQQFSSLLTTESRAFAITLLDQLNSDSNAFGQVRGECAARGPDASPLVLEMRLAKVSPHRVAVVWRDLSTQKASERDLAQARRQAARAGDQQPEFLANVSHQVRTPLNAILGFAEIMMDERFGPLGNARYKDYLKDIHGSGRQVITLIDDLLDLSRIEAGKLDLRVGAIDINKIIVDCVAEAHVLAHRERIIVRTSFGARLPPVMADERSARQIIGNLLSNAIKFNEPGGQVIVSTASSDAASVVVRIRDTGIGMSDGDIASALQPFRQLAPTKNASGTGLGLPLTKALVGANGASLSMRSRPNEGTMVEVTFQATVSAPTRVPA